MDDMPGATAAAELNRLVQHLRRVNSDNSLNIQKHHLQPAVVDAMCMISVADLNDINNTLGGERNSGVGQPVLATSADGPQAGVDASVAPPRSLTELLLTVSSSLAKSTGLLQVADANAYQIHVVAIAEELDRLSSETMQMQGELDEEQAALDTAQQQADGLQEAMDTAEQACMQAQNAMNSLQQQAEDELEEDGAVSQDLADQLASATQQLDAASQTLTAAQQAYAGFNASVLKPAKDAVDMLTDNLNNIKAETSALAQSSAMNLDALLICLRERAEDQGHDLSVKLEFLQEALKQTGSIFLNNIAAKLEEYLEAVKKKTDVNSNETQQTEGESRMSAQEAFMALMAQIRRDMDKGRDLELKVESDLNQVAMESSIKDLEKKSEDYNEQVRKAKEMEETMGCVGKVLGWVVAAVGFVAAAFTGGASLAIAAVGLALTAQDAIAEATGGVSIMGEAMKPLMEKILEPLIKALGNVFSDVLTGLGVDAGTAEMVGQILGAVAAVVALVAGAMLAGNLAGKVASAVMEKVGGKLGQVLGEQTMERIMNSVVSQTLRRLSQGVGSFISLSEEQVTKIGSSMGIAAAAGSVVQAGVKGTGDILVANAWVDVAKIDGKVKEDKVIQELLRQVMQRLVETSAQRTEVISAVATLSDDTNKRAQEVRLDIVRDMRMRKAASAA